MRLYDSVCVCVCVCVNTMYLYTQGHTNRRSTIRTHRQAHTRTSVWCACVVDVTQSLLKNLQLLYTSSGRALTR